MSGQIRVIYASEPTFPATDQHPSAVRYQVGGRWVDAVGGEPSEAEVTAALLRVDEARSPRDERLLAAVDAAKTAVAGSKSFTAEQAAVLSAVFDGLGKAITGEGL